VSTDSFYSINSDECVPEEETCNRNSSGGVEFNEAGAYVRGSLVVPTRKESGTDVGAYTAASTPDNAYGTENSRVSPVTGDPHALATRSLAAYIENCNCFFVLTPRVDGTSKSNTAMDGIYDYGSWLNNGWSMVEKFAYCLKPNPRPMVVIHSALCMEYEDATFGLHHRICDGYFPCCAMGHSTSNSRDEDGKLLGNIQCEKSKVREFMDVVIDWYEKVALDAKDLARFRFINSSATILLDNLPLYEEHHVPQEVHSDDMPSKASDDSPNENAKPARSKPRTLAQFLATYRFPTAYTTAGGFTPLRYACMTMNLPVVRQLLKINVDANSPLELTDPRFGIAALKGSNILNSCIGFCNDATREGRDNAFELLDLLVHAGASIDVDGCDLLTCAAWASGGTRDRGLNGTYGVHPGFLWVLSRFPNVDVNKGNPRFLNANAATISVLCSDDINFLKFLYTKGCHFRTDFALASSVFWISCAWTPSTTFECVKFLYDTVTSCQHINCRNEANTGSNPKGYSFRLPSRLPFTKAQSMEKIRETYDATALFAAARSGKKELVLWLLMNDALVDIPNSSGIYPIQIAVQKGFHNIGDILEKNVYTSYFR